MTLSSTVAEEARREAGRGEAFAALRHRDFRFFWFGQLISVTGSQMQLVAINWHVYMLTRSAAALGLVGLVRVLPIILCSLIGGVFADAINRKRLMMVTQTTMLVSAASLALVTAHDLRSVWPIFLLTAISSAATAFDNPARQALLPSLVPARDFPNAVTLSFIVFQVAMIVGPVLAGLLLGVAGPAVVYALNALSFIAVIVSLALMQASGEVAAAGETAISFASLIEGLRFVWRTPIIVQTMTLDFAATFFASATALLPIFAADILRVGARGLGFLAAAPAIGAILIGTAIARIRRWWRPGALIIISVIVYGAATLLFGLSRNFWFSMLMLALTGAADTVSSVLRQTIRQLVTPDHLRGRMTSVNMIFFMGGPQLGEFEAGVVAEFVGAPASVVIGGLGCILAAIVALWRAKSLLSYELPGEE
ncbi:MAG: MFS transporter [Pyrinomonas methylaliphatogenes]|nr:MFS transporter [Pyrinomonas methylaliphatogenes]